MEKAMGKFMTLAGLVLVLGVNAKAGELATPPILSDQQDILVGCAVTNLRHFPLEITTLEIDENGDVVGQETVLVEPGRTATRGGIRSGPFVVHRCVFRFSGTAHGVLGAASASHCTTDGGCLAQTYTVVPAQPVVR